MQNSPPFHIFKKGQFCQNDTTTILHWPGAIHPLTEGVWNSNKSTDQAYTIETHTPPVKDVPLIFHRGSVHFKWGSQILPVCASGLVGSSGSSGSLVVAGYSSAPEKKRKKLLKEL